MHCENPESDIAALQIFVLMRMNTYWFTYYTIDYLLLHALSVHSYDENIKNNMTLIGIV